MICAGRKPIRGHLLLGKTLGGEEVASIVNLSVRGTLILRPMSAAIIYRKPC